MARAGQQPRNLKYYFAGLALLWSLGLSGTLYLHLREEEQHVESNARIEANALYRRDLLYLDWSSRQGGVYVPVSKDVQPNPRLAFLPERDVRTADGRTLTLVNPAYMVRQVYRRAIEEGGGGGHLTSSHPLDPADAPDPWEAQALAKLQGGATEVSTVVQRQGQDYLRVLRPLAFIPHCAKCHPADASTLHAGISLEVPLAPLRSAVWEHQKAVSTRYLLLWAEGLGGLFVGFLVLRRQMRLAARSEERRSLAEQSVNFLTFHDSLTGLPNRQLFNDRVRLALAQAERLGQQLAVAQFGLDNFKQVNGSLGHSAGDRLLQEIAHRLTACLRPDDSVARFGNDRFLLLFPGLRKADDAVTVLDKILRSLDQPLDLDGREVFITASSGLALFPADGRDGPTLLRNAESALNRAKTLGRGNFQFYAPAMNFRAEEQIALETGLRRALELGQLEVHYQPQVDGASGEIVGAEALLRWHHPEFGMVSPEEFIPLAEESGQILAIGRWVLETACRQAVCWQAVYDRPLRIAVNLSPRQFQQPDLVEMIEDILAATGLPPQTLEIEITEGTLIRDFDRALENLTDLKVRGIQIAIDDFGTGYSSLSYLVKFPIDRLKIDRSFVAGIEADEGNQMVVSSIVDLTARMRIALIAEGVETERQRDILLQNSCRYMQGFLFGRPTSAGTFTALLGAQ